MIELIGDVYTVSRELQQELGREPTPRRSPRRWTSRPRRCARACGAAKQPISLETPVGEDEENTVADLHRRPQARAPADVAERTLLSDHVEDALAELTPASGMVLRMRFGIWIDGRDGRSARSARSSASAASGSARSRPRRSPSCASRSCVDDSRNTSSKQRGPTPRSSSCALLPLIAIAGFDFHAAYLRLAPAGAAACSAPAGRRAALSGRDPHRARRLDSWSGAGDLPLLPLCRRARFRESRPVPRCRLARRGTVRLRSRSWADVANPGRRAHARRLPSVGASPMERPLGPIALEQALAFTAFLAVAFYEELLARGYILQNLSAFDDAVVRVAAVALGLRIPVEAGVGRLERDGGPRVAWRRASCSTGCRRSRSPADRSAGRDRGAACACRRSSSGSRSSAGRPAAYSIGVLKMLFAGKIGQLSSVGPVGGRAAAIGLVIAAATARGDEHEDERATHPAHRLTSRLARGRDRKPSAPAVLPCRAGPGASAGSTRRAAAPDRGIPGPRARGTSRRTARRPGGARTRSARRTRPAVCSDSARDVSSERRRNIATVARSHVASFGPAVSQSSSTIASRRRSTARFDGLTSLCEHTSGPRGGAGNAIRASIVARAHAGSGGSIRLLRIAARIDGLARRAAADRERGAASGRAASIARCGCCISSAGNGGPTMRSMTTAPRASSTWTSLGARPASAAASSTGDTGETLRM